MRTALSLISLACLACSVTACKKSTSLSIAITTGQETGAFTADPPVTKVNITVTSLDGTINRTASVAPGATFDLGDIDNDQQISVEVDGVGADGKTSLVHGRSLDGLALSSLSGTMSIFVQRIKQWARPPGGLGMSHVGGVAGAIGEQYVVLTGGAKATGDTSTTAVTQIDGYDLYSLGGAVAEAFPLVPTTIVSLGSVVVVINGTSASLIDYVADEVTDLSAPAGLSFADVAGGGTVFASDGRTFVVGAMRASGKTSAVLQINEDNTLAGYSLTTKRQGAAATWVDGVGLVVAGGASTGQGVEVLTTTGTGFVERGYAADPVEGAGAIPAGANSLALVGGILADGSAAPTRLVDATCVQGMTCTASPVVHATLPAAMKNVVVYGLTDGSNVVVGDESATMGMTRTFIVGLGSGGTQKELLLKEARRGATPVATPLGTLAIVGGEHADGTPATSIESFFPPQ